MYSHFLTMLTTLLHLQSTLAAPGYKRCMGTAEITNLEAHWPKHAGHGPVVVPCSTGEGAVNGTMSRSDIEGLAKRYLADERSLAASVSVGRRCMTDAQIEAFQAAWPKGAGRGPALVACPVGGEDADMMTLA